MEVLTSRPSALVTDIDGTLSRIVARPEDAVVSEGARQSLRQLADQLALVGVITAREETVARRMVGVDSLSYIGNYALAQDEAQAAWPRLDQAKSRVRQAIESLPCVTMEEKGLTFALHYRNCEEPGVRERLLGLVGPIATEEDAKLLEGKQVVELAPRSLPDKGAAIARLAEDQGLRGLVFVGDDLSDVAVFREIARRRREEGLPGLSIAVIDGETEPAVREAADVEVSGVGEVEELLASLSLELRKDGGL